MVKVSKNIAPAKAKVKKVSPTKTEVVLAMNKVTPKKVTKPIVVKVDTKTRTKTQILKNKLTVKKVVNKTKSNSDEVKLIPGSISLRLAEKRKLYERVYHDYVPKVMRPMAIAGGYAYITIGIFLALLMANPALSNLVSQTATAVCYAGNCTIATSTEVTIKPVEFKSLPPIVSGVNTNLQLVLNQNSPVRIVLLPISGEDTITISGVSESASNIVNFLLPTATLSNGSYLVQAELYDENTKQIRVRILGPTFIVENNTDEISEVASTQEVAVLGVSTSTTNVEVFADEVSNFMTEELLLQADIEDEPEIIKVAPENNNDVFDLTIVPGSTPNQSILKILPTFVFSKVELALKLKGNGEIFFLGNATKADEVWFYWLDNMSIPNGSYSLIIRGYDNGELKEEATYLYNNITESVLTTEDDLDEIKARVNLLLEEKFDINELAKLRASYATSFLKTNDGDYSYEYFTNYLPKFDRLFEKYASAVAGGYDALVILADDQLEKYLDTVIVDNADSEVNEYFGEELTAMLIDIKEFIRSKEAEILNIYDNDRVFDFDKDGLTDYDEVVIYETDPKVADTDNDGILDSVEIILGYDPIDPRLEAVSRFNEALNTDVFNDEILSISAIEPFYLYTDINSNPEIFTSVSGKGIPNSFSRLYLGNFTESVIVKIGPAGTFTKTIDKDFLTVERDVVLAVTDNTGRIVMRGQPLQLGKSSVNKQIYSLGAIDATVIMSTSEFKNSNTIGALGVVSFGLILLLLGKALVPRKEPISLEIV